MTNTPSIADQKRAMRQAMKERRARLFRDVPDAAQKLRDNFLHHIELPAGSTIAAYVAQGDEINPAPLLDALRAREYGLRDRTSKPPP